MPWTAVSWCADCWDRENPDHLCPRVWSDTHPRTRSEWPVDICWQCGQSIYGQAIKMREWVDVPPQRGEPQ